MAEIKVCECGSAHWADKQCPDCAPKENDMSKLAHSNDETMHEIERRAREQDSKRFARAKVLGVGRDAENAKTLVVYWDKVPTDNDLRRTHDLLRSNVEFSGEQSESAGTQG